MDDKIVIELIKKDIEELRMLIGAIEAHTEPSDLIIDICKSKANVLLQEISLLGNEKKGAVSDYKPDDLVSTESAQAEIVQKEDYEVVRTIVETGLETQEEYPVSDLKQEEENISDEVMSVREETDTKIRNNSEENMDTAAGISASDKLECESEIEVDAPIEKQKAEYENKCPEPEIDYVKPEQDITEKSADVLENNNGNGKVLGESFIKEPSLNERFSNLAQKQTKISPKPISNLKKAIGINDRFLFTRELFENSMGEFEAAIEVIDGLGGLSEAISYLEDNFKWQKNEASLKFIDLVKRRFNN